MKLNFLSLIFIFLFSTLSYSQIKFENGYIIMNDGIVQKGLIKNYDWKNNPTELEFRKSINEEIVKIKLEEFKEFGFEGGFRYVKEIVKIDRSPSDISKLSNERNPIYKEETLLLKELIKGYLSIYQYEENDLRRFFYKKENMGITQLVYRKYKLNDVVATNLGYIQQFKNEFSKDGVSQREIERLQYTSRDLVNFAIRVNNLLRPNEVVATTASFENIYRINARAGLLVSNLSASNDFSSFKNIDFNSVVTYRIGLELELVPRSNNGKWAVIFEPSFVNINAEETKATTQVSGGELTGELTYRAIELPLGVRHYFFLNDKSKLFLNAQYSFDINLNSDLSLIRKDGSKLDEFKINSTNNLAFGFGYKYGDKASFEFRYAFNKNYLKKYAGWNSTFNSFSVIFGYRIF
jgi:hypothetical protein